MNSSIPFDVAKELSVLIGSPLKYGFKSRDMDLYQLAFGETIMYELWNEKQIELCKYAVHHTSAMFFYWANGTIEKFYNDSSADEFHSTIAHLLGETVRRVAISTKNDLWFDFGICKIVIVTREDGEESWRFFQPRSNYPHLIATNYEVIMEQV